MKPKWKTSEFTLHFLQGNICAIELCVCLPTCIFQNEDTIGKILQRATARCWCTFNALAVCTHAFCNEYYLKFFVHLPICITYFKLLGWKWSDNLFFSLYDLEVWLFSKKIFSVFWDSFVVLNSIVLYCNTFWSFITRGALYWGPLL